MITNPLSEPQQLARLRAESLPYTFAVARPTLTEQARLVWNDAADLPAETCPDNYAQISIMMHPAFCTQEDFPQQLLEHLGLICVGAKPAECWPRFSLAVGSRDSQEPITQLFLLAKRQDLQALPSLLETIKEDTLLGLQLQTIETIETVTIYDREDLPVGYDNNEFLIAFYPQPGLDDEQSRQQFTRYLQQNKFEVHPDFFHNMDGLLYLLVRGKSYEMDPIGQYALVSKIFVPPMIEDFAD